uniref:Uncharacterized protein n=1 Tax=Cucumis melo TaxID=3656 RepID=A0A9I9E2E5_CUCME
MGKMKSWKGLSCRRKLRESSCEILRVMANKEDEEKVRARDLV